MSEEYISTAEVRDLLAVERERRELITSQKSALNHAEQVCTLSTEDMKQLIAEIDEKLQAFGAVVGEYVPYKIAEIRPRFSNELRACLYKERVVLELDQIEELLDLIRKYE